MPIPIYGGAFATPATAAPGVVNPLSTNPTGVQGGSTTGSGMPQLPGGTQLPAAQAKAIGGSASPAGTTSGSTASPGVMPSTGGASGTLSSLIGTAGAGTPTGMTPATGENGQTVQNGTQTQRQDDRTLGELQSYYGEGMGSWIYSMMQTGGINEQLLNQVDTSQIAAMQPQINQGQANLNSTLGAQGISGNSSTAALANSQYLANTATQENAQISNNYLQQYDQGQQMLESILGGVLKTNQEGTANSNNIMDDITGALGLGQAGTSLWSSLSSSIPGLG
jgi:hypothetical protein